MEINISEFEGLLMIRRHCHFKMWSWEIHAIFWHQNMACIYGICNV